MRKLTILLITIFSIYLIYSLCNFNNKNYVIISDKVMNKYISANNINNYFITPSIEKTIQDIRNNRTIKVDNTYYYLKKVLRESDVLIISIGMEELTNHFNKYDMNNNYNYFNKMNSNINILVNEIRKYAYSKIIFVGYFNPTSYYDGNIDKFFYNVDTKLNELMKDKDIIYISLYERVKGNKNISIINDYL